MNKNFNSILNNNKTKKISEKKEMLHEIIETLDSEQLNRTIEYLSTPYYTKKLKDYLMDENLPEFNSQEFSFLIESEKYSGNIIKKRMIKAGVSDYFFKKFIQKYKLTEISNGIYIFPNKTIDAPFVFQAQYSKAIISHESALYLLDMTDVIPKTTMMSMPMHYKLSQIYKTKEPIDSYDYRSVSPLSRTERKGLTIKYPDNDPIIVTRNHDIDSTQKTIRHTLYNNPVQVTTPERTISDILKPNSFTEEEVKEEAIKQYFNLYPQKKFRLRKIAKQQNILNTLDRYLWQLKLH